MKLLKSASVAILLTITATGFALDSKFEITSKTNPNTVYVHYLVTPKDKYFVLNKFELLTMLNAEAHPEFTGKSQLLLTKDQKEKLQKKITSELETSKPQSKEWYRLKDISDALTTTGETFSVSTFALGNNTVEGSNNVDAASAKSKGVLQTQYPPK